MSEQNVVENEHNEPPSSSSISANDLLTTIYDITRAIFRHLPVRSVDSCALVCQSWSHLARLTKSHRHTIQALTYPSILLSSTTESSLPLCDFDRFMSSYINNDLWSIPYLAFVVATRDLEEKGFYSSPSSSPPPTKVLKRSCSQVTSRRTEHVNISQALVSHLNKSCQLLMITSYGIVTSNDDNQSNEIESGDGMSILFLPKFPPNILGIYPFESSSAPQRSDMSRSYLHQFFGGIPDDIPIRCVILFCTRHRSHTIKCIEKLREYYPSVVIIGGFVHKVHLKDRQNQGKQSSSYTGGMALTGDTNHLTIRQVVLENNIHTRENVKNKLTQLKSNNNQSSLSFGIQVSCIARGSDFYNNEKNVECSEFRNLFPNTPLIGIFGNGEIGHNYLPNEKQTSQQQRQHIETNKDLLLTYSTVFSLISLHI